MDDLPELVSNCHKLLTELFSTDRVRIFYKDKREDNNFKVYFDGKSSSVEDIKIGLVGHTISTSLLHFIPSGYNSNLYNPKIDIDTTLPIITAPVCHESALSPLAVFQVEYNISRVGMTEFRIISIDQIDIEIIELIVKILARCLNKFTSKE